MQGAPALRSGAISDDRELLQQLQTVVFSRSFEAFEDSAGLFLVHIQDI